MLNDVIDIAMVKDILFWTKTAIVSYSDSIGKRERHDFNDLDECRSSSKKIASKIIRDV